MRYIIIIGREDLKLKEVLQDLISGI